MNEQKLNEIATEIRGYVVEMKEEGHTPVKIRELVVGSLNKTTLLAFQTVMHEIIQDPNAGFSFTFSIYETLGGVNKVMLEENLKPIHLNDIEFVREVLVEAMEDFSGENIDTIMNQMDAYKKGGQQ